MISVRRFKSEGVIASPNMCRYCTFLVFLIAALYHVRCHGFADMGLQRSFLAVVMEGVEK